MNIHEKQHFTSSFAFPGMVSEGPCLVPVADFHKDDVVMRIETNEWQSPQSLAPDVAGLQICFEKPGDAGGLSLNRVYPITSSEIAGNLHIKSLVKADHGDKTQWLIPSWQLCTSRPPVLLLKAAQDFSAWTCELGVHLSGHMFETIFLSILKAILISLAYGCL